MEPSAGVSRDVAAAPTPVVGLDDRDRSAADRDDISQAQDATAAERDRRAVARDARAEAREESKDRPDAEAATDRNAARRDRISAQGDRSHADADRLAAQTDRTVSALDRHGSLLDELTGAYRRGEGLQELEREISRSERGDHPFAIAFLDVDHLKQVNDAEGHGAGDRLLVEVVHALRRVVRDYDVIVRYGGDEFLLGAPDLTVNEIAERLGQANSDLRSRIGASFSVGLAEHQPGEELSSLVSRADAAMYAQRKRAPQN